jgi:hypothetical protein
MTSCPCFVFSIPAAARQIHNGQSEKTSPFSFVDTIVAAVADTVVVAIATPFDMVGALREIASPSLVCVGYFDFVCQCKF